MRFFILFTIIFLGFKASYAQKYTISGYVSDSLSAEKLIGVTLYETRLKTGNATNNYGFYSLTFPSDTITLVVSYMGYKTQIKKFFLKENIRMDIYMDIANELKTVEISADKQDRIELRTQMSTIDVPILQIKKIPALLGEVDVLKALQLLPGVKSGGEGSTGLYVRGGGPDQNLILLDGVPVYNASHLFGFFSVFNADAIKSVSLVKGGFPARYGGRLSSVIDIGMKEGNSKKLHGEGSVGIIATKLSLEGPIIKDRTSFIISARRTYIDLLTRPLIKMATQGLATAGYYFYDLNSKINHRVNDKNHLFLSFYGGDDKFYFSSKEKSTYTDYVNGQPTNITQSFTTQGGLGWGNTIGALRWNHLFSNKLFCNTTATYTRYRFYVKTGLEDVREYNNTKDVNSINLKYQSGIKDWGAKTDFEYFPSPTHTIRFGTKGTFHTFNTGAMQYKTKIENTNLDTTLGTKNIQALESGSYYEHEWEASEFLKFNGGLHFSSFHVNGRNYYSLQPRFSGRWLVWEEWSLKASYAQMTQFIHLLTNSNIGLPTDLWVPATDLIKPQKSEQYAAGIAKSLKNNMYELSVEGYYKKMTGIIEYYDGSSFLLNSSSDWQKKVEAGKGWSYGGEFLLQKKEGKTTGWVGYTLSYTNRQFPTINFGKVFPYKYDRRHDFSFVISHKINDKLDISGTWVFSTGNAVTMALAKYNSAYETQSLWNYSFYQPIEYYGGRNNFRMPVYHRADIGINYHKKKKWGEAVWNLSVYNAYNRWNPYFIYYSQENGKEVAKQLSLFPIIPSVSYGFKF